METNLRGRRHLANDLSGNLFALDPALTAPHQPMELAMLVALIEEIMANREAPRNPGVGARVV